MNEMLMPSRPSAATSGRVMLCNIGRLGDTILRNSILDSVFRTYEKVDYICGPGNAELVLGDPRLNEVVVWRNTLDGLLGLMKTAWRHHYDGFIDLKDHRSQTSLWIAAVFRSKLKTGWNSGRQRPFHRDVKGVCAPLEHKTQTMRRIGELAGLERGEYKASLMLSADSIKWFREKYAYPKPYIFINLSATGPDRRWPGENWVRYLHGCGLQNETMLINGVPEDREMAAKICAHFPHATIFRPRQFMDVAAAIMDARLVLTPDTGVVHAASALNKPIVALYSSGTELNRNGPLSDRKLIIQAPGSLCEFPSDQAIRETLEHGLP